LYKRVRIHLCIIIPLWAELRRCARAHKEMMGMLSTWAWWCAWAQPATWTWMLYLSPSMVFRNGPKIWSKTIMSFAIKWINLDPSVETWVKKYATAYVTYFLFFIIIIFIILLSKMLKFYRFWVVPNKFNLYFDKKI